MNTTDLILYYVDLLIMQYNSLPKARGMVSAFVTEAVADQISIQVGQAFDLNTAVGVQLDMIGAFRGARRAVPGLKDRKSVV